MTWRSRLRCVALGGVGGGQRTILRSADFMPKTLASLAIWGHSSRMTLKNLAKLAISSQKWTENDERRHLARFCSAFCCCLSQNLFSEVTSSCAAGEERPQGLRKHVHVVNLMQAIALIV